jgi:type II secretory pathway pseudopilin PulG
MVSDPCHLIPDTPQRGALFGLDARMAIGVFALLALIAGYVAFGRLATARDTALLADIQAFEQALAEYQTDMGTFYLFTLDKQNDDSGGAEDLEALWDKSKILPGFQEHWNGPYLHRDTRKHREFGRFSVFYAQSDRVNYCTTDSDCFVWLSLSDVPAAKWAMVNRIVDEGGGAYHERLGEEGKVGRVQSDGDTDPRMLIYRTVGRP